MKTTVKGVILELNEEQKAFLGDLMARYCAARAPAAGGSWSFNRLLEGVHVQEIRVRVQGKFNLNSRQSNDAVDAQTVISSQKELLKLNYDNARKKVEFTRKRLEKAKSSGKRARMEKRLEKEERKLARSQKYIEAGTIPKVVFGTKRLFVERCKGNVSREEWRDARSNRYVSRGDESKGGNLNARIIVINGRIYLEIAAEMVQRKKSVRYNRMTVPIYLAHKPSKKTGGINGLNYRQMVLDHLKTGGTYQVEIIRRQSRYYVHVTIEEDVPAVRMARGGAIGGDTNPDGIGLVRADYLGQFKESLWLPEPEWMYARADRRANLIGEAAALLVEMTERLDCILAVEDLDFKNDKSVSAKFNRLVQGFVWSAFLRRVARSAARKGVPLAKVKPPYSSVIAILKYLQQYGLSNHEAAGYVIARRGLGIDSEKVPDPLVARFIRKKAGFYQLTSWKQWSSIKNAVIAALTKTTKKEVKSLVSWQHYRKKLQKTG